LLQKDSKPCKPKQCNLLCGSLLFQIESPFPIAQRKIQEPIARLSTRSPIAHHQASLQKTDRASSDSRGDRRSLFGCSIGQIGRWRYDRLDFLAQVRSLNYDGGCHPAEIQNDRAITKLSLFNCNATTVTRPMPTILQPSWNTSIGFGRSIVTYYFSTNKSKKMTALFRSHPLK
jgi:hypothetical protein